MSDNFNKFSNVANCIIIQYSYTDVAMKAKAIICKAKAVWLLTNHTDL